MNLGGNINTQKTETNILKKCLCMHAKSLQLCLTLYDPMDCSPPGSSVHGYFPGKTTGVDCHFLLQGIFPTQGSNLHLLHWQPPGKLKVVCDGHTSLLRLDSMSERGQ